MDIFAWIVPPTKGNLFIDGKIIDSKNIRSYFNIISHVSQDIFIFNDTVENNIALGNDI